MAEILATTSDAFLNGRVTARQPQKGFRSGLDTVFLAAACSAVSGDGILDAGCGAGVASLCLLVRVPHVHVTGVEIDAGFAALARANATANGMEQKFSVVLGDVTGPFTTLEAGGVLRETYDHVIANPPFYEERTSRRSQDPRTARARVIGEGELESWARFLAGAARPGGTCSVIYDARGLRQLLDAFDGRFGALKITPLFPRDNATAIRIIVSGSKGSRGPLSIAKGIVLHNADGSPTRFAEAILRDGCGLEDTLRAGI